ncbi:MAG: hypothetical protein ACD_2C00073G0031 [uncultured bacterium (gcode 4)]|uniref:Uncharacterized protein n=1 Tax=uncultured bacterium (gcode 4) TaxID=1234023 RepID=K2G3W4_9BACT|nr:MAG: hypothetical protein ACD_2C00073G0031 [uncultured bacterium (gcode 4)]
MEMPKLHLWKRIKVQTKEMPWLRRSWISENWQ